MMGSYSKFSIMLQCLRDVQAALTDNLCNVQAALTDILSQHGGLSGEEATVELARMAAAKRYVRDIWS